jgi:inner membrane protein
VDSVTQIALGAGVAEAVLGRKVGWKAALVGAVCGTLPDLDSFIPYADAVATVTYHRSFSHSLIVLSLISPLVAVVVQRCMRMPQVGLREWWLLVFLVLITHPLLDGFTVYGTQLLWPLYIYPYSGSTIFIIDPAYTLPLGLGVLCALGMQRNSRRRYLANLTGLVLSSLYLLWTFAAKFHIESRIRQELALQQLDYQQLLSTPAPFNTILWRLVVMADGGYFEAYYSVFDAPHRVDFVFYPDEKPLLAELEEHWPVQRLQWFTHGFYSVRRVQDALVLSDLRMGVEGAYTFSYHVANFSAEGLQPVTSTQLEVPVRSTQLTELLQRTFNPVE